MAASGLKKLNSIYFLKIISRLLVLSLIFTSLVNAEPKEHAQILNQDAAEKLYQQLSQQENKSLEVPVEQLRIKLVFIQLVETMKQLISEYKVNSDIDTLASGTLRSKLFITQTLAELFADKYDRMHQVHETTKRLEDSLGGYRSSVEKYNYAVNNGASADKIESLSHHKESAKSSLIQTLNSDQWTDFENGALAEILEILNVNPWDEAQSDFKYMLLTLSRQMQNFVDIHWNMQDLQGANGLHDLRKEVRFYLYKTNALQDFLGTQDTTCQKGAKLPGPETGGRCLISQCLQTRLSDTNSVLSEIKDKGEGLEGVGKEIPPELLEPAQKLYQSLRRDQVFESIRDEFTQCVEAL